MFVALVQLVYFVALVPVVEAVAEQCHRLGVDARMADGGAIVHGQDAVEQEAAVLAYVLQAVGIVGAAYE